MPCDPHSGSKVWKTPDREIGKPGENRGKVIAHRDLQPTAAFHDRENRCNLRSRLWAADVDPVLPTQGHGTHGILREVITQLKFRIFQKSCKFPPKRDRVLASLAKCAGRQCNGLRCLDLAKNIIQKRLGCFLTPTMARGNTRRLAASFCIDGKQFVHLSHNRGCNRILGISATRRGPTAMIISLHNLRVGLKWWHQNGWPSGMHNSDYADLYAQRSTVSSRERFHMRHFCPSRWLLASTITFVLFLILSAGTTHVNAQQKASPHKGKGESAAVSEESPIEKLGRMIAGTWEIDATLEPDKAGSKPGKDVGKSVIRFGPGKVALIEDYRTHGDQGTQVALGIFWYDGKGKGYRTMFCDDQDPSGCSLYDGLGNWEGSDWVFHHEYEEDKKKVKIKQVLTATSPSSFIARFYRSEDDAPMKLWWTVKHSKTQD